MSNDKFRNKYRISSIRAKWWNYAQNGAYFITICTAHREYLFGDIVDGKMQLSAVGEIVNQEWDKSFEIRRELFCDTFVIMPNHIHAILRIENGHIVAEPHGHIVVEPHGHIVSEPHGRAALTSPPPPRNCGVAFRSPKSISSFVAGFKSSSTKLINELRNTPKSAVWQTRFHDHIIRNNDEYWRIARYIANNPLKWAGN